jgi:hypothetical protein
MAIRYSGDVEVRMEYRSPVAREGLYYATIRAPGQRGRAILSVREVGLSRKLQKEPKSPESFDEAALSFLEWAEMNLGELPVELDEKNRMIIRRRFQAPCPIRTA